MNFAYTLRSAGGFLLLFLALFLTDASAPLLAQGNIEWQEVWVNRQLRGNFPNHPNAWMNHGRSYTGLAYDKWNDVVYIVNPKDCNVGGFFFRCPEIHAWHADSGTVAHHIGNPANGTGKLFVDTQIIDSSFSQGQYEIFKIDLDDEGRIFVCNVVAPIWGICYPGPPPDCDPDYLSQGPFRIYRYDSHDANPKQVYRTQVLNPALAPLDPLATSPTGINSEMNWTMWGTSFDVVGKRHVIHSPTGDDIVDSVRIFASGGKFYSGAVSVNDQINVFVSDTRTLAPMEYRLGLYLQHNEPQSGIAAHGIAATGPFMESQIWMDSNFRETVLNNQGQNPAQPLPQTVSMSLNQSIDLSTTGPSGAIKYYYNETFQRPFLIVADGMNSSTQITDPNYNTTARVIDLGASPDPEMWPPQATPQFSNERLVNLTGIDNFISDVDYKVWVDPITGLPHLQVFVLMTGNGIACYRTKKPLPVELQMFQGFVNDSRIDLVWQVTSEVNNHGFEIHRSFDGGEHWEEIG
ncbi:MAG: hypothetical protein CL946_06435, partial [Ectothiorhodospiraceae bacterium]|nr:hypothetical protein [Ectothiorhodospiraceae bacterium]